MDDKPGQILTFLQLVAETLMRDATHQVAVEGAHQLSAALAPQPTVLPYETSSIGALTSLDSLPGHPLTDAVRELSPTLPWVPSHRVDDDGAHVGLVLLEQLVDLSPVVAGLTILDVHSVYPEHDHPPAEVYLILGGEAEWRYGGADEFVTHRTGDIVHNNPSDRHEIRTGASPTVAVWTLWPA